MNADVSQAHGASRIHDCIGGLGLSSLGTKTWILLDSNAIEVLQRLRG